MCILFPGNKFEEDGVTENEKINFRRLNRFSIHYSVQVCLDFKILTPYLMACLTSFNM